MFESHCYVSPQQTIKACIPRGQDVKVAEGPPGRNNQLTMCDAKIKKKVRVKSNIKPDQKRSKMRATAALPPVRVSQSTVDHPSS